LIYLIEYNRPKGRLVTFKAFDPSARIYADNARHEMELGLNRKGVHHEVVILEAANENALRRTHRRYFEDVPQIVKSLAEAFDTISIDKRSP
jgi:hypothetical protein